MSHELRTPLNAILGYTELIVDQIYGPVPEKILDVLDRVEKSGRHLLGLINDVLDLSKIEAGQLVLSLGDYSFSDVVQAVASAVGSLAAEKRLPLAVDVAPDLPVGRGDERRITQVLLNLVGNAIKFTEAGEVAVRVTASDGAFLAAVADTGPGIREDDRAEDLRGVPAKRQLTHENQRRHRPRTGDRQADRGNARRAHLGRVHGREGLHLLLQHPGAGRTAGRRGMSKRILVVEDQEDARRIVRDLLAASATSWSKRRPARRGWRSPSASGPT